MFFDPLLLHFVAKQVCKSPSPSLHSSAWKRIKSLAFSRCRNESKPSTCPYMHSLNNKSIKVPTYAKIRTTRCIWFCTRLRVSPYDVELTQRDLITRLNEFGRVITKFPASISEFPRNPMPSSTVRMCACTFAWSDSDASFGKELLLSTVRTSAHLAAMEQQQHQQTKKRMRGEFKNLRRARPDKNWITKRRR